jgi:hypothetical protein
VVRRMERDLGEGDAKYITRLDSLPLSVRLCGSGQSWAARPWPSLSGRGLEPIA